MKAGDLHKVWSAPDNSQLTAKQQSFRLPVHVAAKLQALCDLYPRKTKTDLVGDLLATALEDVIQNLPVIRGRVIDEDRYYGRIYDVHGPAVEFRRAANRHYQALQEELGITNAPPLFDGELVDYERPDGDGE